MTKELVGYRPHYQGKYPTLESIREFRRFIQSNREAQLSVSDEKDEALFMVTDLLTEAQAKAMGWCLVASNAWPSFDLTQSNVTVDIDIKTTPEEIPF